MTGNVIKFAPAARKSAEIPLEFVELRLANDCSIQMTLYDDERNVVVVLDYALASKPQNFDLDLLRAAWDRWRGNSPGIAS
jgi:hypothetical protein